MDEDEGSQPLGSIRCCICYKPLQPFSSISKISEEDSSTNVTNDLLVCDAVAYIYGISSKELQNLLNNYSSDESIDLSSVVFCASCVLLLQESYRAYRRFENIIHPSSFVKHVQLFRNKTCQVGNQEQINSTSHFENTADFDNLFDDFNLESEEHVMLESEEKHVPDDDLKITLSKPKHNIQTNGAIVKLEKLSEEDLQQYSTRENVSRKVKKPVRNPNSKGRKPLRRQKDVAYKSKTSLSPKKTTKAVTVKLEKGPFKCDLCDKTFSSRLYIKYKHFPIAHSKTTSVTCEICGKLLKTRDCLVAHMRNIHSEKVKQVEVKIPCQFCGQLLFKKCLKMHIERKHSAVPRPTFKCNECDKVFANKATYDYHIVIHREDFIPFKCSHCGKTFNKKTELKIHEAIHIGEKKFECQECGKKFLNLFNLKKHIDSHATERKYVCDECGKSFKHKQHFATHLKVHKELAEKGENSVKCPDCGKTYKHSVAMRKHRYRSHGDKLKRTIYKCSFCEKILSSAQNLKLHENSHKAKNLMHVV